MPANDKHNSKDFTKAKKGANKKNAKETAYKGDE